MNLSTIRGLGQILLCVVLFAPSAWAHQASMTAIGISIDNLDQFVIAISGAHILARGYFEVREPFSVNVELSESLVPRSKLGHFWSDVVANDQDAQQLIKAVLAEVKGASEPVDSPFLPFQVCTMTSPLELSTSQKELASSALAEVFGCTDETFIIRETQAITFALEIESGDVENSPIAVVVPDEFTYILGEDSSSVVVVDTFPPPFNLDPIIAKHNIWEIIVVQSSDRLRFGPVYGTRKIPIRYESSDIIARGAAIMATLALPEAPVSILPLALGVVLHGSLSHIVIPSFSVLPQQVKFTLTTVHPNQRKAAVEIREGLRARAVDNRFVTILRLYQIPPAPAGSIPIEVTLNVDRNNKKVTVKAVETLSGRELETSVDRSGLAYEEGVLESQQAAGEKYYEEDAQFRASVDEKIVRETQPEDAVQLFRHPSIKHEEL